MNSAPENHTLSVNNIYPEWGSVICNSLDTILSTDSNVLSSMLVDRGLLLFRNLGSNISDSDLHRVGNKFGKVWSRDDYISASIIDRTIQATEPATSYASSENTMWLSRALYYHADMAHIGENSYPCRLLYMAKNSEDGSGETHWLNLELAWSKIDIEYKKQFDDISMYFHYMYLPGTNIEKLPFLKTNPRSGRISPRLNNTNDTYRWIHHIEKSGNVVSNLHKFVDDIYCFCETIPGALYSHKWQNDDLIVFDNHIGVHRRDKINVINGTSSRLLKRLTLNIS